MLSGESEAQRTSLDRACAVFAPLNVECVRLALVLATGPNMQRGRRYEKRGEFTYTGQDGRTIPVQEAGVRIYGTCP